VVVADVDLAAYLLLGGPNAALAQQVLERDPTWAAPVLWRSEFRSIVAAHMRHRKLALAHAWQEHELAEGLFGANEYAVGGERVLQLVAASLCPAYDCQYLALAEDLRVPLVTWDAKVLHEFPRVARSPQAFMAGTA
jgi:predicted nucleic acid-binding protein